MATGQATGRSTAVWVNQSNVSGDLNSGGISLTADTPEKTTFGDTYHRTFTSQLKAWTGNWDGLFSDVTTAGSVGVEESLNNIGTGASAIIGYWWHGTGACDVGYEGPAILESYDVTSPVADAVSLTAAWSGSNGLARTWALSACVQSGSTAASTTGNSGCSYDMGASFSGTLWGFLRVTLGSATTAGSLQATIQDSGDDSSFSDFITFTTLDLAATGSTFETLSATGASRYIRAQYAIGGTTGSDADATFLITAGKAL